MSSNQNTATDWRTAQTDASGRPLYGIDAEIQAKLDAKKDPEKEAQVRAWMEELIGEQWSSDVMADALKDGIMLVKLVNAIQPGSVRQANTSKLAFKQMENIDNFLKAAKAIGVKQVDLFTTIDLFEARNIPAVVSCLYCLGSACQKLPGYSGPVIGVKFADKNERQFSEEQRQQAANAPTRLAMGSYGLASQAGTRSISRDIVKTHDAGISGETSRLLQGSHGLASQSGTTTNSRQIVKTSTGGSAPRQAAASATATDSPVVEQAEQTQYEEPMDDGDNILEELEKLAALRDKGIVSEEEFQEKKMQLLGL